MARCAFVESLKSKLCQDSRRGQELKGRYTGRDMLTGDKKLWRFDFSSPSANCSAIYAMYAGFCLECHTSVTPHGSMLEKSQHRGTGESNYVPLQTPTQSRLIHARHESACWPKKRSGSQPKRGTWFSIDVTLVAPGMIHVMLATKLVDESECPSYFVSRRSL
jgi:hypothetical protein